MKIDYAKTMITRNITPVTILALAAITSIALSANTCSSGWFGEGCKYKCHCHMAQSCGSNGECQSGSKCQDGWFGLACQYGDLVASSKVLRTSKQGDTVTSGGPCFGGDNIVSWTITSPTAYYFTWMRLIFADNGFMERITVTFKKNSVITSCLKQSNSSISDKILDIYCLPGVGIDQVILTGEHIIHLCSLFISGGRNIALKQNATITSTYDATTTADKAVDGNPFVSINYCAIASKDDASPTWTLMFSNSHQIYRFDLYNRDTHKTELKGFAMKSFNDKNNTVFDYKEKSGKILNVYTVIPDSILQNVLMIQISSTVPYFTICEVITFGEVNCPIGKFGRDCESTCNCAVKDEACFISTGACPSGCSAGFYGERCNTHCPEHFYGVDCKYPCSQNCVDKLCNNVSGVCIDCMTGKQGDLCNEACHPGQYGKRCSQICSKNCSGDGSCHAETGACNTCEDGYMGDVCNEKCQTSYFGAGCLLSCSANCTNTTCHHVSGNCYSCVSGMHGAFCERDLLDYLAQSASDDTTSLIVGPVVAAVVFILILVIVVFVWRRRRNSNTTGQSQRRIKDDDVRVAFAEPEQTKAKRDEPLTEENEPKTVNSEPCKNVFQTQTSMSMKVKDLQAFLLSHEAEYFKSQFYTVPSIDPAATTHVAHSDKNKSKNRYKNICAYDHSRVCLSINLQNNEEDYINASYVEGYKNREKFIAAQGPNNVIIKDFVRMLWEQKIEKVVMLTHLIEDGKQKCERYWPEDNKVMFGVIQIKLAATQVFADYTIRKIRLKKDGEPGHIITHFHFTSWPDKGVPTTPWSLVDFEQRVFACPTTKPIVVHCSAGVGRTGTFIALHNVVKEAIETGYIDFYKTLVKLRKDRMNMIQTAEQYVFLHKAAEVSLLCLKTTISATDIVDRIQFLETRELEMTNMEIEFNSICDVCTEDKNDMVESESGGNRSTLYENSRANVNKLKNRFSNILSKDLYRPHLTDIGDQKAGDYINAVLVPSFTKPSHQILTQLPLPTTVSDFWRLVTQFKVSLIVAFEQDLKAIDLTIGDYLPLKENEPCNCDLFTIKAESATSGQFWLQQALHITANTMTTNVEKSASHKAEEHHVTHLKCTSTDLKPRTLLTLAEKIRSHNSLDNGRTVFICRNGATFSGLVYVVTLLLDRIDNDNHLTIPLVVGAIKAIRPQVIPTAEQYGLLYAVLNCYSDSTNVYCNIGDSKPKAINNPRPPVKSKPIMNNLTSSKTDPEETIKNNDNVYANNMC